MSSPRPPRRRSLSFKFGSFFKRTRTSSVSSSVPWPRRSQDDDYWRPLPETPGSRPSGDTRRGVKAYEAPRSSLTHGRKLSCKDMEVVDKDEEYYIEGADVVFLVQNTLFRIHRFFLTRESPVFRDMLSMPVPEGMEVEGTSDNNPIVLTGVTSDDFSKFLWTFYNKKLSVYDATIKDWIGVLRLAHMWQCDTVRELAFTELAKLDLPPLERVIIARDYDAEVKFMDQAKTALADRKQFLTEDEARSLGSSLTIEILQLRERRRDRRHGVYSCSRTFYSPPSTPRSHRSHTPPPIIVPAPPQPPPGLFIPPPGPMINLLPPLPPPTPEFDDPPVFVYPP